MPVALARPCVEQGCGVLITSGSRCAQHQLPERARPKPSRSTRGYDRDFYRARARAIRAQPWCSACGSTDKLSGDHIIPLSKGGTNDAENIRVLCVSCNSRRGNR